MKHIILTSIVLSYGCVHTQTPEDTRKCCQRVSMLDEEMEKFSRYCKLAIFLDRSKYVGDVKVKSGVRAAIDVCKFVFQTDSESDLLTMVELNNKEYNKVRHYIIDSLEDEPFWMRVGCDPIEAECEEF